MKVFAVLLALPIVQAGTSLRREIEGRVGKIPHGWKDAGPAKAKTVELAFFLKNPESGVAALKKELLDRSDPKSKNYGQWLSNNDVHDMVAPEEESVRIVVDWIESHGATAVKATPNSDVVLSTVPLAVAENMLATEFRTFSHAVSKAVLTRCLGYSLPVDVAAQVALVGPSVHFPRRPSVAVMAEGTEPEYSNTPDNLRQLYSVHDVLGGAASNNKQAVTAFLAQYYDSSDEASFWSSEFPAGASTNITLVGDATMGRKAGVEAMLDIEYMPAMGALIPTEFWGFSGASPMDSADEPFLKWLYTVGNTSDAEVPLVFSTSYGEDETSELPSDYASRIETEFVKCGARGISLLFASGDSGAASDAGTCPNDQFMPMWPAASPFVTAVGGVTNGAMPESAWSGSSGGFSNIFDQPSWQQDAVTKYLSNDASGSLPPSSYYNASGRGFPDISAQSVSYPVVANGFTMSVAGTSCASPCSGGIFGLLNDARLAAGKTSLGFLNPMLYSNPDALNDCQQGTQGGCLGQSGFPALEGWDPVTGLGSPNFEALLEVVMALP